MTTKIFKGLEIFIETDIGETRTWFDPLTNKHGQTLMKLPYGYIRGVPKQGADGDAVDVYLGPNEQSYDVFIVRQQNPNTKTYDEDKVMLGFTTVDDARKAYLEHYDNPEYMGNIDTIGFDVFTNLLNDTTPGKLKLKNKGLSPIIKTVSGDDVDIANKLRKGEIDGPVVTPTCILMNMRITGTGETVRHYDGQDYIFNRPAGVFLSDKFLQMCNGLPVVWYHPENGAVDFNNWKDYIIGSIVMPYIKGAEVWGIAKIFDLTKLDEIYKGVGSTSPFVTSKNIVRNDGKIDEQLEDLNHVALVPAGHWDQLAKEPAIKKGEIIFKEDTNLILEKKDNSSEKFDNANSKEVELKSKTDKETTGGTKMTEEEIKAKEKSDAEATEKAAKEKDDFDAKAKKDAEDKEKADAEEKAAKEKADAEAKEKEAKEKADADAAEKLKADAENPLKNLEKKVDALMSRVDKKDEINVAGELAELKTMVNTLVAAEKKEGEEFSKLGSEHEVLTADDDEKETLVNAVSEMADSAHAEITVKRPAPMKHESKFSYINRVFKLNEGLVSEKHKFLINKIDAANFTVAKEALAEMQDSVTTKTLSLNKNVKGARVVIPTDDGAMTDVNYGRI